MSDKPWESSVTLLIDADILCYRAAAASDGRCYTVVGEHGTHRASFKYKKEAVAYCKRNDLEPEGCIQLSFNPDPVSYALNTLKLSIKKLMRAVPGDAVKLYVTGQTNFRHDIYDKYKDNRVDYKKPVHLDACKQYLMDKRGAILSKVCEADDEISIEARRPQEGDIVICSIDKDLDMIPGWHYNWNKGGRKYHVSTAQGLRLFYRQLLTGDRVDNIPGIKGIGPAKSKKIVPDSMEEPGEMYQVVLDTYIDKGVQLDTETDEEYYQSVVTEVSRNARLLWLQSYAGEIWQPPSVTTSDESVEPGVTACGADEEEGNVEED